MKTNKKNTLSFTADILRSTEWSKSHDTKGHELVTTKDSEPAFYCT